MQARDVMSTSVGIIGQDATVKYATKLMLKRGASAGSYTCDVSDLGFNVCEARAERGTGRARGIRGFLYALRSDNAHIFSKVRLRGQCII